MQYSFQLFSSNLCYKQKLFMKLQQQFINSHMINSGLCCVQENSAETLPQSISLPIRSEGALRNVSQQSAFCRLVPSCAGRTMADLPAGLRRTCGGTGAGVGREVRRTTCNPRPWSASHYGHMGSPRVPAEHPHVPVPDLIPGPGEATSILIQLRSTQPIPR